MNSIAPLWDDLPKSIEAERAVVGAVLISERAFENVSQEIDETDFYAPYLAEVYRAARTIAEKGGKVSPPVVLAALNHMEGAQGLIAELVAAAAGPINAGEFANFLADLSRKRKMHGMAAELIDRLRSDMTAEEAREHIEGQLFAMDGHAESEPVDITAGAKAVIAQVEAAKASNGVSGLRTGFADIDRMLGGLHKKNLIILAGRPAMGKSALALNIATNVARHTPTLFFSLEMSLDELAARELAARTGIPTDDMRAGRADTRHMAAEAIEMGKGRLLIDDRAALSVAAIRTAARRAKRKHGIGLVVVDYLQLMRERAENKVVEISEISRGLKAISKDLDVPVIALSQLSRAVEQRDDKRPVLSDLRESGSIEQDADAVGFLYREEYYLREPEQGAKSDKDYAQALLAYQERLAKCHNVAQLILAKHRHGPIGTINLHFNPERVKFSNLDRTTA